MTNSISDNHEAHRSRRKVRKGTMSCWECKRRKVRCTFESSSSSMCLPCTNRGTVCISQEFVDTGRPPHVGDRLTRVENMLEKILERLNAEGLNPPFRFESSEINAQYHRDVCDADLAHNLPGRVAWSAESPSPANGRASTALKAFSALQTEIPLLADDDSLSRYLLSALSTNAACSDIQQGKFKLPSCLYGLLSWQGSSSISEDVGLTHEQWQLPSPDLHPIIVSKRLLILCCILQGSGSDAPTASRKTCQEYNQFSLNLVEFIRNLVLSKENLIHSIDGVECLIIESIYRNNAGHLKEAWQSSQSALTIAYMLRLGRKLQASQGELRTQNIWFRLLQLNRYLSLMLGLPEGAPGNHEIASLDRLSSAGASERLERLDTLAAGRMLQRSSIQLRDARLTNEIDLILEEAAACLPPQWWLVPYPSSVDDSQCGNTTLRIMHQLAHYHLVARLHVPYLLYCSDHPAHEQSRATALFASREILTRYISFQSFHTTASYCHGVDIIMFIACTTLCLAHINSAYQKLINQHSSASSYLAHQRPNDRGLVECSLELLKNQIPAETSENNSHIAKILTILLISEKEAAGGVYYSTSTTTDGIDQACTGELDATGNRLQVSIPWIGTLIFDRKPLPNPTNEGQIQTLEAASEYMNAVWLEADEQFPREYGSPSQGIDTALFEDVFPDFIVPGTPG